MPTVTVLGNPWTNGREQYERTYVLLPPDCGVEWPMAALRATWGEKRYTVGGSADDAGIGPLIRTVLAVNPQLWPGDLGAFFARYYEGLDYRVFNAETPDDLYVALVIHVHGGVDPPPPPPPPPPDEEEEEGKFPWLLVGLGAAVAVFGLLAVTTKGGK